MMKRTILAAVMGLTAASAEAGAQSLIDDLAAPAAQEAPEENREDILEIDDVQDAWDAAEPKKGGGQVAPGIQIWRYHRNRVEKILVRGVAYTMIYLPEWEVIEDFYLGDTTAFDVNLPMKDGVPTRRNVLLARPAPGVVQADTSLQILGKQVNGSRNVYTARLRSTPVKHETTTPFTVFVESQQPGSFGITGPTVQAPAAALPASPAGETKKENPPPAPPNSKDDTLGRDAPDYLREIPFDMGNLHFGEFEVLAADDESRTIAPVRVFRDSHFTILDFGEGGRADRILRPVVYRVVDEVDNPVNTRTSGPEGNLLVVESVGYNLTLRNGNRTVCIRYKGSALELPGQTT